MKIGSEYKVCYWDSVTQKQRERDATPDEVDEINARAIEAASAAIRKPIPQQVPMLQFRLALIANGRFNAFNTYLASIAGSAGDTARTYWNFAANVVRDDPAVATMAAQMNLSAADLDQLFSAVNTM